MKAVSLRNLSTDDLRDYLDGWHLDALANQTIRERLPLSFEKIQRTLEFLPSETGRVLQIGASPFFLSSLLKRFGNFDLELVDFVIQSDYEVSSEFSQGIIDSVVNEFRLNFFAFDIEVEPFPYDDNAFDGVIMSDVLQTLSRDPVAVLAEIYRMLKPGSWLLITTPNAAYYGNLLKVWLSNNPNYRYSNQTSINRVNRQYTMPDFIDLFSDVNGLVIDQLRGASISSDNTSDWRLRFTRLVTKLIKRNELNEEYIFCLARKHGTFYPFRSTRFYQSYAPSYPPVVTPLERSALVLPSTPLGPSRFPRRVCKLCDELDWKGSEWLGLLDEMGEPYQPGNIHRKAWEWAQGLYALGQLGLLHETATALGVGTGTEQMMFYLANRVKMVTATDIYGQGSFVGKTAYADMLATPEKYAKIPYRRDHLTTMYMDGTKLEFPNNHFDFAFSFSSIEHFGSYEKAARAVLEMERVVKPGGAVIITTEVVLNGIPHREFFRPLELQQYLVRENGLQLVEDVDFTLSDQTLAHPVDFSHPGFNEVFPHIICHHSGVYWTSVCLVLSKPSDC